MIQSQWRGLARLRFLPARFGSSVPFSGLDLPKIYILHDERRYVEPLMKELTKRGVPFEEWNLEQYLAQLKQATPSKHLVDTSVEPPRGIFYNRISACGCRLHRDIPQLARGILMWLESYQRRIVNGVGSLSMVTSKMEAQIAMNMSGIRTPRSIIAMSEDQIINAASTMGGKFMLEPNRRDLGKGVVAFNALDEVATHLKSDQFIRSADSITIVQEYVKSRAPYVNRVEIVGGQLLYGMHVDVSRGWDRLIPGFSTDPIHVSQVVKAGSDVTPVPRYQVLPDFYHELVDKYITFMKKHDIEIASFEFTEDTEGNAITFDVDICSTFNSPAEYRAKVPKAGIHAVADYLGRVLELERPIRGTQVAREVARKKEKAPEKQPPKQHDWGIVNMCDGGMGRELRRRLPQTINQQTWSANALMENPDEVKQVHIDFIKAGAKVITTNNYACTPRFLAQGGLESRLNQLTEMACVLACKARDEAGINDVKVMASLPPLEESYRADLVGSMDDMLAVYEPMASLLAKHVDIILCETMSSPLEAHAAAKAASKYGKSIWVSWTLNDDLTGTLRSGDTVEDAFEALQGLPVDAFLFNCCVPEAIEVALPRLMKLTDKPVGAMPNCFAPLPTDWTLGDGGHGFRDLREDMGPRDFAGYIRGWLDKGATIVGGCCGIGPEHIQAMVEDIHEHSNLSSVHD